MTKRRRDTVSVHVGYVDVCIESVLAECSDEQLIEALAERGKKLAEDSGDTLVGEALERLNNGDIDEAKLSLERYLFPKWRTPTACFDAYTKRVAR